MKDNDLLMIVLAFFLGFCFRKMMGGQLIEGQLSPGADCQPDYVTDRQSCQTVFYKDDAWDPKWNNWAARSPCCRESYGCVLDNTAQSGTCPSGDFSIDDCGLTNCESI